MAEEEDNLANKGSTSSCARDRVAKDSSSIAVIDENAGIAGTDEKRRVGTIEEVSIGSDESKILRARTEVIILDEAPAARETLIAVKNAYNPRVIELSDKISKMELRREFKVDVASQERSGGEAANSRSKTTGDDDESAEILSRLPPGTILIKQSGGASVARGSRRREDSDYVHDSSKDSTNSSESSSAASYTAAGKVRRMQHRTGRNKKIVEVRRNPARNKKKKPIDEDFLRPRQRLLSVKRRAGFVVENSSRKRVKATPTPYMNTRSVTRKMHTVGATYQAPTVHDEIEWKEWPAHGMHERPIWHPQVGLAFEYIDRSFVSLDGRTYREIIDEPVIEVVSVDPHPERLCLSRGKRKLEGTSTNYLETIGTGEARGIERGRSFEACMHGSLHSVLAYCSRVVTPAYKKNVDVKLRRISRGADIADDIKAVPKLSIDSSGTASRDERVIHSSNLVASSGAITLDSAHPPSASSSSETSKLPVLPRRTISFTNVRNIQGNILQEVFSRSSKNTLIFLKPTDPPMKIEKNLSKTSSTNGNRKIVRDSAETVTTELSLAKLDDNAISDEALMEMSSMYNKLLPSDKVESTSGTSSRAATDFRRPAAAAAAGVATKVSMVSPSNDARDDRTDAACIPRLSSSNQASEIAKILAEYNEKAAKNSRTRRSCYPSSSTKTVKFDKEFSNVKSNRTTYFSLVEQSKSVKLKREEDDFSDKPSTCRGDNISQESADSPAQVTAKSLPATSPIKTEDVSRDPQDDGRAMDLTTGKLPVSQEEQTTESVSDESTNQQWLQELIEDTALLYCAAAGVRQEDVADYLDTLDSSQSIQWLGS